MNRRKLIWSASLAVAGVLMAVPHETRAQARRVTPERRLLGINLGRDQLDVIRRYGRPSKVQTVALAVGQDALPGLGGAPGGGVEGGMGAPGGYPGGGSFGAPGLTPGGYPGGGGSFGAPGLSPGGYPGGGGAFGAPGMAPGGYPGGGGIPTLPPGGGSYPGGGGGYPGGGVGAPGGFGAPGGGLGGANVPEYSTAILWIYEGPRAGAFPIPKDVRLEFLINEDGRVAQISVAAPAGKVLPGVRTQRGVGLGSDFTRVIEAYGNPERHRLLPGLRFYETYYTKNYHTAFTFDTQPKNKKDEMKVVRITIALAED